MYIEYIETYEKSESKRRAISKETIVTKECSNCKCAAVPLSIAASRGTTTITVKWFSSGSDVACSKSCVSSMNNRKMPKESYVQRGKKSSKTQKGRTYEEIHGCEKAVILKESLSRNMSNANYRWSSLHRTPEEIEEQRNLNRNNANSPFSKLAKGKTYEDFYGIEKAEAIKNKISEKTKGEKNPMFGRPSPLSSGNGRKGYYRGTFFRSSLELLFMHKCWKLGIEYQSAENKEMVVDYEFNGTKRTYRPDFYLPETDTVVEIKPLHLINSDENIKKFEFARSKFSNFIIITEKDLSFIEKKEYEELIESQCIKPLK